MSNGQMSLAAAKASYNQQQSTEVAPKSGKEKSLIDFLSGDKNFEKAVSAVAGKFFTPDRFLRLAINAVKKTPALMYCDPQSVLGAFMTSAALGLEPNTVLQQAFLIPYKKSRKQGNEWVDVYECNFQIGARGFITLAHRSPQVATIQSEAIHEHDLFEHMQGSETFLKYQKRLKERGDLIGAFCFTKMTDGNELATVLPLDEVHKIRSKSETFNALKKALDQAINEGNARNVEKAQKKFDETPWVMWEDDMAAKSATKKHAKQLPISPGDALTVAAQIDGDGGSTIDMSVMTDPDLVRSVMKEGVEAAETAESTSSEAFGTRPAALEDAPSPSLNTMTARARQAETVEVKPTASEQQAAHAGAPDTTADDLFDKLKKRLETLTDIDMLDTEADLIGDVCDTTEQEDILRAIYKDRREEMTAAQIAATTKPAARPAARRGGMIID